MSFKGAILELCYGPHVMNNVKEQFLLIKFYAMRYLVDCIFFQCVKNDALLSYFLLLMESLGHSLEYILIVLY